MVSIILNCVLGLVSIILLIIVVKAYRIVSPLIDELDAMTSLKDNFARSIRRLTSRKVYLCFSGVVYSADGDRHFISSWRLPDLYNVPRELCFIISRPEDICGLRRENYIHLHPRSDGNYNL